MLIQAVTAADPKIQHWIDPAWLDPLIALPQWEADRPDLTVFNYHRGLHSRWMPEQVAKVVGPKIVIMHDTYETQPDRLPWELLDVCDAMVVHEPCDLLSPDPLASSRPALAERARAKVRYWRQGVPEPSNRVHPLLSSLNPRPYVGTCGFAFPWKGFELLCDAAHAAGWGVYICSHNATDTQVEDWCRRSPWVAVNREYLQTGELVAELARCDATAFLYQCANSGTSGAIRLGIAAGKPVLATLGCRQFRDLSQAGSSSLEQNAITWIPNVDEVSAHLATLRLDRFSPMVIALREKDSWRHLGKRYADLYQEVLG
jgi:hypothetical protein